MEDACAELPKWKCHKIVHAVKIDNFVACEDGVMLSPITGSGYARFKVPAEVFARSFPPVGDQFYYVVYDGGYQSWSPVKEFEDGYALLYF